MKVVQLIVLGLIFCSCSSEDSLANIPNQEPKNNEENSGRLLSSVQSDYKTTIFKYNSDSTLHSITEERNGEKRSESELIYENGKISEMIWKDSYNNSEVKRIIEYKGDLLVKQTFFQKNEVIAIEEYFYDENSQMIKQIQKLEWNNEATKQTRVIDIHKVPGKNEIQLKYNGVLSFILTYDDNESPYCRIKGYSEIFASHFHGITNNILSFKRIYKNGIENSETSELSFDSNGEYLLETTKKDNDQRLICKETYTYN